MATWGERLNAASAANATPAANPAATPNLDTQATVSSLREVWRSESDVATAEAADAFRHSRTLKDVAIETLHRGDPVVVLMPNFRLQGMVEAVGPDLLAVRSVGGRVDVHLHDGIPMMLQIGERVHEGGARETVADGDFRSALLAHEKFGEVTIGCTLTEEAIDGTLVVGADHIGIVHRGGNETYFPLYTVSYVTKRR
jgi:hypothetical protein